MSDTRRTGRTRPLCVCSRQLKHTHKQTEVRPVSGGTCVTRHATCLKAAGLITGLCTLKANNKLKMTFMGLILNLCDFKLRPYSACISAPSRDWVCYSEPGLLLVNIDNLRNEISRVGSNNASAHSENETVLPVIPLLCQEQYIVRSLTVFSAL